LLHVNASALGQPLVPVPLVLLVPQQSPSQPSLVLVSLWPSLAPVPLERWQAEQSPSQQSLVLVLLGQQSPSQQSLVLVSLQYTGEYRLTSC
jgi:hypothetical protein